MSDTTTNYGWPKPDPHEQRLELLLRDVLDAIDAALKTYADTRRAARAYRSTNQSIANATAVVLAFDSERYDTDTMHDNATNNTRLTCKTAGLYEIKGNASFAANSTGVRGLRLTLNGTTIIANILTGNAGASLPTVLTVSTQCVLAVNDYVELLAYQDSGGALNVLTDAQYSPEFMMAKIG